MNDAIKMQISAFVDGELPENESELLLRRLSQDDALRQQAAEYYAIGRTMRGERTVPGLAKLRGRIRAALDDEEVPVQPGPAESARRSYSRPLGGFAIAATVALAAIFGLQQLESTPETTTPVSTQTAADAVATPAYTVPAVFHELHREGRNNINARLATLRILEEEIGELESPRPAAADPAAVDPVAVDDNPVDPIDDSENPGAGGSAAGPAP